MQMLVLHLRAWKAMLVDCLVDRCDLLCKQRGKEIKTRKATGGC